MHFAERWTDVTRTPADAWRIRARAFWSSWGRPIPFALLMAGALAGRRGKEVDLVAPSPAAAVAEVLTARGLLCDTEDVAWVTGPSGVWGSLAGGARALVRARVAAAGEPSDLYVVDARLSPEGVVLDVGDSYDVSETSGVDESRPVVRGHVAAYTTSADGLVTGVHVLDLDGRAVSTYRAFTGLQRGQLALTNLQRHSSEQRESVGESDCLTKKYGGRHGIAQC